MLHSSTGHSYNISTFFHILSLKDTRKDLRNIPKTTPKQRGKVQKRQFRTEGKEWKPVCYNLLLARNVYVH